MEIHINELKNRMHAAGNLKELLQRHNLMTFDPLVYTHYLDRDNHIRAFLRDLGYDIDDNDTITIVAHQINPLVQ